MVGREKENTLYSDYKGIVFPYSLPTPSKSEEWLFPSWRAASLEAPVGLGVWYFEFGA